MTLETRLSLFCFSCTLLYYFCIFTNTVCTYNNCFYVFYSARYGKLLALPEWGSLILALILRFNSTPSVRIVQHHPPTGICFTTLKLTSHATIQTMRTIIKTSFHIKFVVQCIRLILVYFFS